MALLADDPNACSRLNDEMRHWSRVIDGLKQDIRRYRNEREGVTESRVRARIENGQLRVLDTGEEDDRKRRADELDRLIKEAENEKEALMRDQTRRESEWARLRCDHRP
ncbi:hypothetical protein [Stappia stellulata]|uniref:hypothetical protein n=1 Tax=Stappia stellulata TaxID=71235 RepID=UPI00040D9B75|nr:hypothetical protein [Stappia stellulata]